MKTAPFQVWVVDDDPFYHQMVTSYLKLLGYATRGFYSGEEFLGQFRKKPDAIILDQNLGTGMQGMEVLRTIREKGNTPVIFVSGQESVSLVSDAYTNGSVEYIGKDSANLIKLKLRLENLSNLKLVHRKRKVRQIVVAGLLAATLVAAIVLVATLV